MSFSFRDDPFVNLDRQVQAASLAGVVEANAMILATTKSNGPRSRVVLYKGLLRGGLSFYTNYEGDKAHELEKNNFVSAVFFWASLAEQIRLEGHVEKLTRQESETYFRTRPRESQIGAWASEQSHEISNFDILAERVTEFEQKFKGQDVPCPPHWGGYHILPSYFEFWFGRTGRLHERYCYERQGNQWRRFLRAP